jgi:hypothetical protein
MSRVLTIGVIASAMATVGWGVPLCTTGSLASYVDLGSTGCMINDKVFANFTDSFANGAGVTVTVTPDTTVGDPGLDFQLSGFTVNAGASNDLILGFTVFDTSGPNIEDASLNIGNGVLSIGTGIVSVGEGVCVGGTFTGLGGSCTAGNSPPNLLTLNVVNPNPPGSNFDLKFFGPVQTVAVSKDISITSGSDGVAALSDLRENFSEVVPEPASIVLLGSALLGLGLLRRRLS